MRDRVGVALDGHSLRRALARLPWEEGHAWMWTTLTHPPDSETLREAGLPERITQESQRRSLTRFVVGYLRGPGRIALIEDFEASPADPPWPEETLKLSRFAVGRHVYWYASQPDQKRVFDTMRWGFSLFKCMALAAPGPAWPGGATVSEAEIARIGEICDHVVVDAYDFEGFVVWSPSA